MSKKGDKRKQLQTRRIGRPETSAKADLSRYEDLLGKGTGIFSGYGPDLTGKIGEEGVPKFAAGGVSDMGLLERAALGVRKFYTPEEKAWMAAREAEYSEYNKAAEKYNADLAAYKKAMDDYNESLKPYQSEVDAYNKAAEEYNKSVYQPYKQKLDEYAAAVDAYNRDVYDPYKTEVDAYNKALKEYEETTGADYQRQVADYEKARETYNKTVEDYLKTLYLNPEGTESRIYEKVVGKGNWSGNVRDPATGAVYQPGQYYATLDGDILYARKDPINVVELEKKLIGRNAYSYTDPRTKKEITITGGGGIAFGRADGKDYFVQEGKLYEFPTAPQAFTRAAPVNSNPFTRVEPKLASEFTMVQPTAPEEFKMARPGNPPPAFAGVAPTLPTNVPYTQEQVQEYLNTAKARAQKSAANRATALNVAASPTQFGLSGFGLSLPFKEGGEVSNEDFIEQMTVGTLPKDQGPPPVDVKASQALRALGELVRGTVGAEALEPGSEAYRTGQALSNMPGVGVAAGAVKGSKKLTELEKYLNNMLGAEQAKRLQRAADEIPGLENQYSAEALLRAFRGGKGEPYQGVITLDPATFEKFASPINEPLSKHSLQNIEKLQWVLRDKKGFNDVPMLLLNKEGERLPFITGHEGRHRSRALAAENMPTTLVEIVPNRNLEFPGPGMENRTAQDWRSILNKTLDEGSRLVRAETKSRLNPEVETLLYQIQKLESQSSPDWEKISRLKQELDLWKKSDQYIVQDPIRFEKLPDVYKHGGIVKRQAGSPPTGEVSNEDFIQQTLVGTPPGIMAQASQEPSVVVAKDIDQPATRSAQAMRAYLEASIPDLKVVEDPRLQLLGRKGQVRTDIPNVISIDPIQKDMDREAVLLHEAEHSRVGKAVQGMPEKEQFDNDIRFDRLYGDKGSTRAKIVKTFVDNKDKIEKFFGVNIPDVYFEKLMYKNQSRSGSAGALFEEQIATLSALEQLTNKSLTKGMPELFPDDKAAAIYDAITGLRQTRLDAKDLPPFTPQYKSGLDWIKGKLGIR